MAAGGGGALQGLGDKDGTEKSLTAQLKRSLIFSLDNLRVPNSLRNQLITQRRRERD